MKLRIILLEDDEADQDAKDIYFASMADDRNDSNNQFVSPDHIWDSGSVTFIYGGSTPKLYVDEDVTHNKLMRRNDNEILKEIMVGTRFEKRVGDSTLDWHAFVRRVALLGRVSESRDVVSIWNYDAPLVDRLYPAAIKELISKNFLSVDANAYSPTFKDVRSVSDVIESRVKSTTMSREREKQLEMMRQVHFMRGNEKKNMMRQAGMKLVPGKRSLMALALQKIGKLSPGQQWRTTSEGK